MDDLLRHGVSVAPECVGVPLPPASPQDGGALQPTHAGEGKEQSQEKELGGLGMTSLV